MAVESRIAFTVIGGFLGAGKSTVLNRILHTTKRRTTVLVNDFGAINVDAALISSQDGDTISLSNGCACCTLGSGLYDGLVRAIQRLPVPEWIVIEASGVADPSPIAQVGLSDPLLELESVLVLVDATSILKQAADLLLADIITRQLNGASVLLLSKTDLAGEIQTAQVKQWLAQRVPDVPLVRADIELQQMPMQISAQHIQRLATEAPHHHSHEPEQTLPFSSWFWPCDGQVDSQRLTQVLKALPRGIIRAKGWLITERHPLVLIQYASGRVRYTRSFPTIPIPHGLVLIATRGTDQQAINQQLQTTAML